MTIKSTFRTRLLAASALALAVAGAGSAAIAQAPPTAPGQPQAVMVLTPVTVDKMQAGNVVAVKGSVAEIFGNKFILQDDTGRTLVELGPQGEDGNAVAKGEQVAVQGRFDRGFVAAQLISHADGRNQAFGPPPPPPPRPGADRGPGGRLPPPPPPR